MPFGNGKAGRVHNDLSQWTDPSTGYPCVMWRHPKSLLLHGYVGLPKTHPALDTPLTDLVVHNGVSYRGTNLWGDPDGLTWVGFTCADLLEYEVYLGEQAGVISGHIYHPYEYVCDQTAILAAQLASFEKRK